MNNMSFRFVFKGFSFTSDCAMFFSLKMCRYITRSSSTLLVSYLVTQCYQGRVTKVVGCLMSAP